MLARLRKLADITGYSYRGRLQLQRLDNSSFLTLFQVAFGLPIAFWKSLEGSVIEMKSATLAPQDTAISLKA